MKSTDLKRTDRIRAGDFRFGWHRVPAALVGKKATRKRGMFIRSVGVAAACALSSGCVYTKWTGSEGRSLTRVSFFGNQSVGQVDLNNGTMSGYTSEQAEVAGAVAAGVAKALIKP